MGFFESNKLKTSEKLFPIDWDSVTTFEDLKALVKIACAGVIRSESHNISVKESGFDNIPELRKICVGTKEHKIRIGAISKDKTIDISQLHLIKNSPIFTSELNELINIHNRLTLINDPSIIIDEIEDLRGVIYKLSKREQKNPND